MDRSYIERNDAARARLRDLTAQLTPEHLDHPIGDGWTVKSALAHLAWWDRYAVALLDWWTAEGFRESAINADHINRAAADDWLALDPAHVLREVVAAAEAMDARITRVPDSLAGAIAAGGRGRILDRSIHRSAHVDEIERALNGD